MRADNEGEGGILALVVLGVAHIADMGHFGTRPVEFGS